MFFRFYLIVIFCLLSTFSYSQENSNNLMNAMAELFKTDIKDYQEGLTYWKDWNEEFVIQFPDSLTDNQKYEYYFFPRILQGGSSFSLTIIFKTKKEAEKYYNEYQIFEKEFEDYHKYTKSMYCNVIEDEKIGRQKLSNQTKIKLFKAPWCSSNQSDRKVGGIQSGMALDLKNKTVYCWANSLAN